MTSREGEQPYILEVTKNDDFYPLSTEHGVRTQLTELRSHSYTV